MVKQFTNMIEKEDYERLKEYYDFQRKKQYNKEQIMYVCGHVAGEETNKIFDLMAKFVVILTCRSKEVIRLSLTMLDPISFNISVVCSFIVSRCCLRSF